MAAVDVYVFMRKIGNDSSLVLHGAQLGPATTVFYLLLKALTDGSASGEWSEGHANLRVSGEVLRSMLADIQDLDTVDWKEVQEIDTGTFRESIMDDAGYVVKAVQY
jgi:hypothetical protein